MAIITYPLNNTEYTAEDAELYHATRTSGVFANDDFPITVSGDGNVVTIGEGIGWIRNSKFSGKVVANKSEMSLDLGLPHATYPRIDAVVLQFNANANASEIIVKNGIAQTNPMPPEVVRTESTYELHLYHVYREAGAASVTASNVTDLRSDSAYCGIMSDDVTMLGDDYVRKDMVGVANGVAPLNENTRIDNSYIEYNERYTGLNVTATSDRGTINFEVPNVTQVGKTVFVRGRIKITLTNTSMPMLLKINGLPKLVGYGLAVWIWKSYGSTPPKENVYPLQLARQSGDYIDVDFDCDGLSTGTSYVIDLLLIYGTSE